MLSRVTAAQLNEIEAFYRLEPWGKEMDDLRFALLMSVTANAWGAKTKPQDFLRMLDFSRQDHGPDQDGASHKQIMMQRTIMLGGRIE